jgi:hypothetical protein
MYVLTLENDYGCWVVKYSTQPSTEEINNQKAQFYNYYNSVPTSIDVSFVEQY